MIFDTPIITKLIKPWIDGDEVWSIGTKVAYLGRNIDDRAMISHVDKSNKPIHPARLLDDNYFRRKYD